MSRAAGPLANGGKGALSRQAGVKGFRDGFGDGSEPYAGTVNRGTHLMGCDIRTDPVPGLAPRATSELRRLRAEKALDFVQVDEHPSQVYQSTVKPGTRAFELVNQARVHVNSAIMLAEAALEIMSEHGLPCRRMRAAVARHTAGVYEAVQAIGKLRGTPAGNLVIDCDLPVISNACKRLERVLASFKQLLDTAPATAARAPSRCIDCGEVGELTGHMGCQYAGRFSEGGAA